MDGVSKIVREKAPAILAEIKKAKSILLHCHPSPDPDSVCSALAMRLVLEQMGKKATVIKGDSEIPQAFMHFPGAQDIVSKNFFEIDTDDYDLFIILDSAAPGMISRRGELKFPLAIKTVNIDHHISNDSYADINLVDRGSPATAFTLFRLFGEWKIEITRDIALNLFLGIYTDTGGFKYEYDGMDYHVFQVAAVLTQKAPDFLKAISLMENSNEKDIIYFDAAILNSVETFFDDHLVIASISQEEIVGKNISLFAVGASCVKDMLKSVIGWDIVVIMTEIEPNRIKMSFRTRDDRKFDLSKLAIALGGGGHKAAAGAVLNMSLEEAKEEVVSKVKTLYKL